VARDEAELAHERAYVEWAYERLDEMLRRADGMQHAAGDVGTFRALKKFQEARRESLLAARDKLVIGRLDFTSPRVNALGHATLYIGKTHVDGDDSDHHAVIDWRAEAAEAFYQATRTHPMGIGRRRTIAMRGRTVTGLSDELLTSGFEPPVARPQVQAPPIDVKIERPIARPAPAEPEPQTTAADHEAPSKRRRLTGARRAPRGGARRTAAADKSKAEVGSSEQADVAAATSDVIGEFELRAEDLLLEELARERTAEMSEVVATIQADQDRLIRAPANQPLIIQGGPGTGKTIVGLHRAAYLLYEQRRRGLDASVLVVGPNPAFMEYINAVLPSLGESSATQLALDQLAVSHLTAGERSRIRVRAELDARAARVLGDPRMADAVETAVWATIEPRDLELGFGRFVLRLSAAEVTQVITSLRKATGSYREARAGLGEGLATAFHANYQARLGARFGNAEEELESISAETRRLLAEDARELMPPVEARAAVVSLLQDRELLGSAGLGEDEVSGVLVAQQSSSRPFPWAREHLPLLDEAARLTRGEPDRYAHVVVDEAQDLSPMQWRMLNRRVQRGSITILGDLAQSMSVWSPLSWSEVAEHLAGPGEVGLGELRLGYRVPRQVMDFVAPLASVAAPELAAPVSFRTGPEPVVIATAADQLLSEAVRAAGAIESGSVAVICPRDVAPQVRKTLNGKQHDHVVVLDPEAARGREFDAVCVVEPSRIIETSLRPAQTLYVALTRPTKLLTIVHSAGLPDVMTAVPSADGAHDPSTSAAVVPGWPSPPAAPQVDVQPHAGTDESLLVASNNAQQGSPPAASDEAQGRRLRRAVRRLFGRRP
jgi:hypothetical protein